MQYSRKAGAAKANDEIKVSSGHRKSLASLQGKGSTSRVGRGMGGTSFLLKSMT